MEISTDWVVWREYLEIDVSGGRGGFGRPLYYKKSRHPMILEDQRVESGGPGRVITKILNGGFNR